MPTGVYKHKLHSLETRKKISNANKGKIISDETRKKQSKAMKGRCLSEEHKRKIRNNHADSSGKKNGMYGKRHSKKTKEKMSEVKKGKNNSFFGKHHTKEANELNRQAHLGFKHTEEAKQKMKGHISWNKGLKLPQLSGENHNRWKGGITPLYHKIRTCFEYRQWRSDVFTRDSFACQTCGDAIGGNLVAHHEIEFMDILERHEITSLKEAIKCEELWNINNGITLCEDCHIELHKKTKITLCENIY